MVSISSPIGTQIIQAAGVAMAMRRKGAQTVALTYFDAGQQMIADVPDVPGDDTPPADPDAPEVPEEVPPLRRSGYEFVERLVQLVEDHTGRTMGIVLGRAYEQWAATTYCHSNAHVQAFVEAGRNPDDACQREVSIPRTTHDFDNPQPLIGLMRRELRNGEIREYRFVRKRRHDCHCRGVPGRIAPLSEEYKASRTARPMYRRRYHDWLVEQCRRYSVDTQSALLLCF